MKKRSTAIAALVLPTLAFLLAPAAAEASSPPTGGATLTGPGVVNFANLQHLSNSRTFLRQGTATPGGCQFSGSIRLPRGSLPVEEQGVALNPATCVMLVEQGTPPMAASVCLADRTCTTPAVPVVVPPYPANQEILLGGAVLHSWFEDPIGIHVNDVMNMATAYPNGSCTTPPPTSSSVSWHIHAFKPTQWNAGTPSVTTELDCARAYSHTGVSFSDSFFCNTLFLISPDLGRALGGPGTTNVNYLDNAVEIDPNATFTAFWNVTVGGPCSSLLTPHHIAVPADFVYAFPIAVLDNTLG